MTPTRIVLLSLIAPALCALAVDDPGSDDAKRAAERASYQAYVDALDSQCDMQIEDLAAMIPTDQIKALRSEHYDWRLQRDLRCADTGRKSSDELAELCCLSKVTSDYYDRRELQIREIEARRAKTQGTNADSPSSEMIVTEIDCNF